MMRARRVPRGAARCWLVRHDISMQSRGEAAHLMPVTWLLGRTLPGCEGWTLPVWDRLPGRGLASL